MRKKLELFEADARRKAFAEIAEEIAEMGLSDEIEDFLMDLKKKDEWVVQFPENSSCAHIILTPKLTLPMFIYILITSTSIDSVYWVTPTRIHFSFLPYLTASPYLTALRCFAPFAHRTLRCSLLLWDPLYSPEMGWGVCSRYSLHKTRTSLKMWSIIQLQTTISGNRYRSTCCLYSQLRTWKCLHSREFARKRGNARLTVKSLWYCN